jgi:hypothetical protein
MTYCIEKNPRIAFQSVDDLIVQTDAPWFVAARTQAKESGQ